MTDRVVVLGAGYAGGRAIRQLASTLPSAVEIEWLSAEPAHVVAHELHRLIRRPGATSALRIPIEAVCPDRVAFRAGRVVAVAPADRQVELADGTKVAYDYLIVAIGTAVADYGIPGISDYGYSLKGTEDVLGINEQLAAVPDDEPGRVVIGGGGLTGIQAAGEVAAYGAETGQSFAITIVEGGEAIYPGNPASIQRALRRRLESRGVDIVTDTRITEVSETTVALDDGRRLEYDVHIWAGGVTGREPVADLSLETRGGRLVTDEYLRTDDERIFAVGDSAWTSLNGEGLPPTAQVAWQTAPTGAANVVRSLGAEPLRPATYRDLGTAISVGDDAIVHNVPFLPVDPLTGPPAVLVKKGIAARMIATLASLGHARRAWQYL